MPDTEEVADEPVPRIDITTSLEFDAVHETLRIRDKTAARSRDLTATLQLNLGVSWAPSIYSEAVFEFDTQSRQFIVDEMFFAFKSEALLLKLGRQYLPFGTFSSRFARATVVEFGETRAIALSAELTPADWLEVSLTAYRGRARAVDGGRLFDWSLGLKAKPNPEAVFGMGVLSDLADSNERILSDNDNRYAKKVSGFKVYFEWNKYPFAVSLEGLAAIGSFDELDADEDSPLAWNSEFTYFLSPDIDSTLRLAGSRELDGGPRLQLGGSATWRVSEHAALTLEYLHDRFEERHARNHYLGMRVGLEY